MKTVDVTPTWEAILPTMIFCLKNSSDTKGVVEELTRMAKLADLYVASVRSDEEAKVAAENERKLALYGGSIVAKHGSFYAGQRSSPEVAILDTYEEAMEWIHGEYLGAVPDGC